MTTRRSVILAGMALSIAPALAQKRPVRIGMIAPLPRDKSIVSPIAIQALSDLGYPEGGGAILEYRITGGAEARAPAVARELIRLNCDIIFAFEEAALRALQDQRSPAPVVFFAVDFDPVESGLVKNVRRPEGNMTGVYGHVAALSAKKLELAQEMIPGAKHFLVFSDGHSKSQLQALRAAVTTRRAELTVIEYTQPPYDLVAGFEAGRRAGVEAFIGISSPHLAARRAELGELFLKYRLPAVVARLSLSEPGFLAGYSFNLQKLVRRMVEIGVRVLKGAKPSDIPLQQADEFELYVNMKTAKALGLKVPYAVLARATKMIE